MDRKEIERQLEDKSGYIKKENNVDQKMHYDSEIGEDVTAYGEFISSYFAWIPPSKQKKRAEELDEKTKDKKTR